MAPPQHNATLTLVAGAGVADDWDRAGGAGPQKFAGEVRGYYRETTDRVSDGRGGVDVLIRRELIIETADLDAINGLDTDDVLTFRVDGETVDRVAQARTIRASRLAGVTPSLQTAKITLADA